MRTVIERAGVVVVNGVDVAVVVILGYMAALGYRTGLVTGLLYLLLGVLALGVGLAVYQPAGALLAERLGMPAVVMQLAVFSTISVLVMTLGGTLLWPVWAAAGWLFRIAPPLAAIDRILGMMPVVAIGTVLVSALFLLPAVFPIPTYVAQVVEESWWARTVVPAVSSLAPMVEDFTLRLPARSMLDLVAPVSVSPTERQELTIPNGLTLRIDEQDELRLLSLVNEERTKVGMHKPAMDLELREVARAHSRDMFQRRYFAHENLDGLTPFDRMRNAGIGFFIAGENLAYAPTVDLAHVGLMNSPGHKENVLRPEFRKVGIGTVASTGYGRMYTQNFTD